MPLSGALVAPDQAGAPECRHLLRALVCEECRLVQLAPCILPPPPGVEALAGPSQALRLVPGAAGTAPFGASLARRLRAIGHEPAVIEAGDALSRAEDPHDVAAGLRILLAPGGVAVLELPWLLPLLRGVQFDRLDHATRSIFTLATAEAVLAPHGLVVVEAEALPQGGGMLRLLATHAEDHGQPVGGSVPQLRAREAAAGLGRAEPYRDFAARVAEASCALLDFLIGLRRAGRSVAAHGASPRAALRLAHAGIAPALLPMVAEADPARQGLLMPGTRIPIRSPEAVLAARPDYLLLLDGDRQAEALRDMAAIRGWGGRFVVPNPTLRVL
jgi:hypothetical protein